MEFYQLFDGDSSTYTYLLVDAKSREAILIDPVREKIDRDVQLVRELGATLKYILDTHVHADHVTGAGELRKRTGAKTAIGALSGVDCADILLKDGDTLDFGSQTLTALATPGHTAGCMSFVVGDRVFTGDALLIRGTGRTDFQEGSSSRLYDSIKEKLFRLPDSTLVYPAHDYKGQTHSTIGLEKRHNPRIGDNKTREEFAAILAALKLSQPIRIHEAVPANLGCGQSRQGEVG